MGYAERVMKRRAREQAERQASSAARRASRSDLPENDEHYRSPLELELGEALSEYVRRVSRGLPSNVGIEVRGSGHSVDVKLVCNGSRKYEAHRCCLRPQHTGQCYDRHRGHFTASVSLE